MPQHIRSSILDPRMQALLRMKRQSEEAEPRQPVEPIQAPIERRYMPPWATSQTEMPFPQYEDEPFVPPQMRQQPGGLAGILEALARGLTLPGGGYQEEFERNRQTQADALQKYQLMQQLKMQRYNAELQKRGMVMGDIENAKRRMLQREELDINRSREAREQRAFELESQTPRVQGFDLEEDIYSTLPGQQPQVVKRGVPKPPTIPYSYTPEGIRIDKEKAAYSASLRAAQEQEKQEWDLAFDELKSSRQLSAAEHIELDMKKKDIDERFKVQDRILEDAIANSTDEDEIEKNKAFMLANQEERRKEYNKLSDEYMNRITQRSQEKLDKLKDFRK